MSDRSQSAQTDPAVSTEQTLLIPEAPEEPGAVVALPQNSRAPWWLDLLLALMLFAAALPLRFAATRGDLWLDEADYAFAAVRGFQANRWDTSNVPTEPEKLVMQRHYHPPFVVHMIGLALRWGPQDRTMRVPSVLFGGLTVALVYLCGLVLFRGSRPVAFASALLLLFAPPHLRASSHALPWSFLIFWLMLLLWTLLRYIQTRREGWLVGAGAALGGMFVTSEVFFPTLLAAALAAPFVLVPTWRERERRRRILIGLAGGVVAFLAIAGILWPVGLLGGALKMLRHYMAMAHDPWPVNVRDRVYDRAPKWAYLYWYWHFYRLFFVCYALGAATSFVWMVRRKLSREAAVLLIFAAVILISAHKAHIIGPEYLAHALPLLSLVAGFFFLAVLQWNRPIGLAMVVLLCLAVLRWRESMTLPGMDARAQWPRWPYAAQFLAGRWQPGDQLLAPAFGVPARWYVLHVAGVHAQGWQIEALPGDGARNTLLRDLASGAYRYVAVGSTYSDTPSVDSRVWQVIRRWPRVWQSDEGGAGQSRLSIYQVPRGTTSRHPLPLPASLLRGHP